MKLRILLFSLLSLRLSAQELSGLWTGYLQTPESHLPYEIAISENNEIFTGYSQITFLKDGVENIGIKTIKLSHRKKEIFIEDGKLVYDNYTMPGVRSKLFGSLILSVKDSQLILQGSFKTRSLDMRDKTSYEGIIFLHKSNQLETTKLIEKLGEMNLLGALTLYPEKSLSSTSMTGKNNYGFIAKDFDKDSQKNTDKNTVTGKSENGSAIFSSRQIEILNTIYVKSDSVKMSLYDNGTVDGDIVSVFINDKMIVSKGRLNSEAIRFTVPVSAIPGDSLILVMFAENLGTIPPNTGLLIIQDGATRHEIRFTGDLQKNSGIILRKRSSPLSQ